MTKIRILQGIRQGKIGGGESYLLGLVENLDRSKYEPIVLAFTDGPMVERLRNQNITTHVIYTETPFDVRVWPKVSELVEKEKIDIVHAHGTRAMSNMFKSAIKKNKPLVYTCHAWSFHIDQNPVVKKLRILSEKYLTAKASVNICGALANRDEARKLFGSFDAEIIYNSVDEKKFNPYGSFENLRPGFGVYDNEILIASIARFTLQKQPLVLLAAFADLCKTVFNAKLLMVGDGEQKDAALNLVKKLGIEDKVIFRPFTQNVPDVLANVDIFVLPSLWEAFPIALLEALSMGKATLATAVDGTPEMVKHMQNGYLIDPTSLQENITKGLLELCLNNTLRIQLGMNAIDTVYKKYQVTKLADKNEAIYDKLVVN